MSGDMVVIGRGSDSFGGRVNARCGLRGISRAAGHWCVSAVSPFQVADPERAALVLPSGFDRRLLFGAGLLHASYVERLINPLVRGFRHVHPGDVYRAVAQRAGDRMRRLLDELIVGGGDVAWSDAYDNLIVNTGLDDYLDKYYKGSAYTAAHYVGLTSSSPTVAAADTMSSHGGWTESTSYSESTRQAFTPGSVSSQSVSNSASKAAFSINGTVTVGGAFLTTSSTKSGTTGTLVAAGAFTGGNAALQNGWTLNVQATFTQADDGV